MVYGFFVTLFMWSIYLFDVPGFHFDEVWFYELARRIVVEPGFWPLSGMNHYTFPFMSYLLAISFKLFGMSFEVGRLTNLFLNEAGVLLWMLWLKRLQIKPLFFCLLMGCLPHPFLTARLGIEVCTAFFLLGGLSVYAGWYGVRGKSSFFFFVAWLAVCLGSMTHVLMVAFFLAAAIAGLICYPAFFEEKRKKVFMTACVMPLILFLAILIRYEPDQMLCAKAGMVIGAIFLGILFLWSQEYWNKALKEKSLDICAFFLKLLSLPGAIFYICFCFIGAWIGLFVSGFFYSPFIFVGIALLALLCFLALQKPWTLFERFIVLTLSFFLTFMVLSVLKPTAARYYQLVSVLVSVFFASRLSHQQEGVWVKPLFFSLMICSAAVIFRGIVWQVREYGAIRDNFYCLWIKENARDSRPVVKVIKDVMRLYGCVPQHIECDEYRSVYVGNTSLLFNPQIKRCEKGLLRIGGSDFFSKDQRPLLKQPGWGDFFATVDL